jgi:saccharopine dehydrogenase-like NADP-dependent oxidoreductase
MRALVLGAYGHYGKLLCQKLKAIDGITVIGAGKREDRLSSLANELDMQTLELDWRDAGLADVLVANDIHVLIHAAGPFSSQDYVVAQACIDANCYYFDLADNREFVDGIKILNEQAKRANLVVASGMGMMALTDSIIRYMQTKVSIINHMDIGYSGAGRMPGMASIRSSLNSCGKPVELLDNGQTVAVTGLGGRSVHRFAENFTTREMLNLDLPELDVFAKKYCLKSITVKGGFGQRGQRLMSLFSKMTAKGLIKQPLRWAQKFMKIGKFMERYNEDKGGIYIEIEGRDQKDKVVEQLFEVHAVGQAVDDMKIIAIVAMIQRLMQNYVPEPGAYPAIGLVNIGHVFEALGPEGVSIFEG